MSFSYKNIKKSTPKWAKRLGSSFVAVAGALVAYGFADGFTWAKTAGIVLTIAGTFLTSFFTEE